MGSIYGGPSFSKGMNFRVALVARVGVRLCSLADFVSKFMAQEHLERDPLGALLPALRRVVHQDLQKRTSARKTDANL